MEQSCKHIVITGASRGLGAALALSYAEPNVTLTLLGRNENLLRDIKEQCEAKGSTVKISQLDLREFSDIQKWLSQLKTEPPISLFIANAGVFEGRFENEQIEARARAQHVLETNLNATIDIVSSITGLLIAQGSGHIAMISSLAAIQPLADAPAYSASKAGIRAYGEALREALLEHKIPVSLIYPGHINTQQTENHIGPLPSIMEPDTAANYIKKKLNRKSNSIYLPAHIAWPLRVSKILPWKLRALINRPFRFHTSTSKSNDQLITTKGMKYDI